MRVPETMGKYDPHPKVWSCNAIAMVGVAEHGMSRKSAFKYAAKLRKWAKEFMRFNNMLEKMQ